MAKSSEKQIILNNLTKLVEHALDNNITKEKIALLAQQVHEEFKKKNQRSFLQKNKCLTLLIALVGICVTWDFANKLLFLSIRFGLLKLLNFYDWTLFYNQSCILENPFYINPNDDNSTCNGCAHLKSILSAENVSARDILKSHIQKSIPIIVKDAVHDDWSAKKFNMSFLFEIFEEREMKSSEPCYMHTNKVESTEKLVTISDLVSLLSQSAEHSEDSWYAFWENCNKNVVRSLRKYYKRPYFVHQSVEIAFVNWIMVSHNYEADHYIKTDIGTTVTWYVQLKGTSEIVLQPSRCNQTCNDLHALLHEGETVLWMQPDWYLAYRPLGALNDNISMMFGGFVE
ncbi:hypothetical protein HELRODRAFT_190959 [Helobdella robusta]|uniref:Cupin-like domain-containing protein n=1 Tax=Helobdella robusta TaxID=6412 RepID=T1FSG6_HELRO|nr:hypothetical protein HELRODRAFT_190959 [Helobdella robusta]ESO07477.1 hypothetical protein HELRODRAFT_190959 [Helobdella robusta]